MRKIFASTFGIFVAMSTFAQLYIPVTNITYTGTTTLTSPIPSSCNTGGVRAASVNYTITPSNATNQQVVWTMVDAGTTGASIKGSMFNYKTIGVATIRATIINGASPTTNYTQDFNITVEFGAVTDIRDVPTTIAAGFPLKLTPRVIGEFTPSKCVIWSIVDAGTTGASISDYNMLNTTSTGSVVVRATIENGASPTTDYTQDFTIEVTPFIPVTNISNIPLTVDQAPASFNLSINYPNPDFPDGAVITPSNATNQIISWSIIDEGTTNAKISSGSSGSSISIGNAGDLKIRATIINGASTTTNYTQDFDIKIIGPIVIPVTNISGIPATMNTLSYTPLAGVITPDNATNQFIEWSIVNTTGTVAAKLQPQGLFNSYLLVEGVGTVTINASVYKGLSETTNYTQDFTIMVIDNTIATSVNEVEITKNPVAFYNTMGTKLTKKPINGLYIVIYDDGTVEKKMK